MNLSILVADTDTLVCVPSLGVETEFRLRLYNHDQETMVDEWGPWLLVSEENGWQREGDNWTYLGPLSGEHQVRSRRWTQCGAGRVVEAWRESEILRYV